MLEPPSLIDEPLLNVGGPCVAQPVIADGDFRLAKAWLLCLAETIADELQAPGPRPVFRLGHKPLSVETRHPLLAWVASLPHPCLPFDGTKSMPSYFVGRPNARPGRIRKPFGRWSLQFRSDGE